MHIAPKRVLVKNAKALKSYDQYHAASDLIDRVETALGRKSNFKTETTSTLNFEMNQNGTYSTTS